MGTAEEAILSSSIATADTQVRENTATTNFGSSATAGTSGQAGQRKTLLTGFDVSSIPARAGISSAVLTLSYYNAPVGAGTLEAHLVTGAWTEAAATWATLPAYDATIAGSSDIGNGATISVDVTGIVSAWVNGTANRGIALTESGGSAVFWMREAAAGLRPTLTVNWTSPPSCTDAIANGAETDVDCGGATCGKCANGKHCIVAPDCASGYCGNGLCAVPPPTCIDAIANGAETDVDCGGPTCPVCASGKHCSTATDCATGYCGNGTCAPKPPTCTDAIANGAETDVDCGGPNCPVCVNGKHCSAGTDCATGYCGNGLCAPQPPTCTDGIANGNETGIDCGGPNCPKCQDGFHCLSAGDCASTYCSPNGVCAPPPPTCTDAIANGAETDVDCGGPSCPVCVNGKHCATATDCATGYCGNGLCAPKPPTCTDGIANGNETDVDCGGPNCPDCVNGKQCAAAADCVSGYCGNGICAVPPPTCTDGLANGNETDVDCGGSTSCPSCVNGKHCATGTDCQSGYCGNGLCAPKPPTCTDAIANGSETDVDCGGPNCSKCANSKRCAAAGDCQSGYCNAAGLCATPPTATCTDGIANGSETDVDCGGATCGKCPIAKHCAASTDCASGLCYAGTCYAQGVSGTVVNSCTLPAITSYTEVVKQYKPSIAATGWGVLTTPPAGTPVIGGALVVHGGRWRDNSTGPGAGASPWPYDDSDTARKLARLGYVVFSPAYRSSQYYAHPAQASDVLCSARYLRDTMIASYPNVSPALFIMGSSAGAHLSALVSHAPTNKVDDGTCPRSGAVSWRGAIGWSGIYDLTTYLSKQSSADAVAELLGFSPTANPAGALAASPWSYVNPIGPDLLLTHGSTDPTLPAAGTTAFHNRALTLGVDSTNVQITNTYSFLHAGNLFDPIRPSQGCTALQFLATH